MKLKLTTLTITILICLNLIGQDSTKSDKAFGVFYGGTTDYSNGLFKPENNGKIGGLSYGFKSNFTKSKNYEFTVMSVYLSNMIIKNIIGSGTVLELSTRFYEKKQKKGFYSQSSISHGEIFFNKPNGEKVKYSYWSLLGLQFGHDFKVSKKFCIDINSGFLWHWNKGFTDNVSPFQGRVCVGLMYNFK